MKKVSRIELAEILYKMQIIKGIPLFATVLQFTDPKLLKRNNPFPNVRKLSKVGILLNSQYEKAVTNQLVREGKDTDEYQKGANTMPLVFGENNQFIGKFNGMDVLQYRPNDNVTPVSKFVTDGKIIDKAKIADFIPKTYHAENQGTDREIMWRKLYLHNVRKITINKETYKVIA